MKSVIENGMEKLNGYDELKKYEKFLYKDGEFVGIKINDDYAIFLNGSCKFIVAKRFANCLSIGSGLVSEFDTFKEAEKFVESNPEI